MTVVTNTFSETGYLGAGATHEVFQLLFKLKKKKKDNLEMKNYENICSSGEVIPQLLKVLGEIQISQVVRIVVWV